MSGFSEPHQVFLKIVSHFSSLSAHRSNGEWSSDLLCRRPRHVTRIPRSVDYDTYRSVLDSREDGRDALLKEIADVRCFRESWVSSWKKKKVRRISGCTRVIDWSIDRRVRARKSDVVSCRRRYKIGAPEHYTYAPPLRDAVGKQPPMVTDAATNAYSKTLRVRPQAGLQGDN